MQTRTAASFSAFSRPVVRPLSSESLVAPVLVEFVEDELVEGEVVVVEGEVVGIDGDVVVVCEPEPDPPPKPTAAANIIFIVPFLEIPSLLLGNQKGRAGHQVARPSVGAAARLQVREQSKAWHLTGFHTGIRRRASGQFR
jgi:hypothetical protein